MATSSQPKRYLLMGFGAVLNRPDVELVDSLPATVPACSFCGGLPSEHYTLSCRHVFCSACFEDIVNTRPSSLRCPVDSTSTRSRNAVPKQITCVETVNRLLVCCWNRQRGCPYTGDLDEMPRHFKVCAFYEVTCLLCSETMPRLNLAAHFRAAHEKRRRSARHNPATGEDPARATDTDATPGEGRRSTQHPPARRISESSSVTSSDEESDDNVPIYWPRNREELVVNVFPRLNENLKVVLEETASKTTENVKQDTEALFLEFFSEIELVTNRLVALADAARAATSRREGEMEGATVRSGLRRAIIVPHYTWVVGPYSSLRDGTRHVDSPGFVLAPGCKVQLRACIDGSAKVELRVSVKVHRANASDVPEASQLPWPFRRTCHFTLLHKADDDAHVTISFPPCDVFDEPDASSNNEVLTSGWLEICKMEKDVFESHHVKDDTFMIDFRTLSPQE